MTEHYDVIIVGTGAGGGTLAHTLAPSGKRILLLERGDFLPREMDNWNPGSVFVDGKYISADTWYDADGKPFQPQVHYFVGGATKLYGAALYRLGARRPGHGVVAPYTGGQTLFDSQLTRYELSRRYADGARICVQPADGTASADGNLLFLVRADGRLAPVTRSGPPEPEPGDSMVVLTARPAG